MATTEFFLVLGPLNERVFPIFFEARVEAPPEPTGMEAPDPRFSLLYNIGLERKRSNNAM